MNGCMTVGADDECLPAPLGHELVPCGLRSPWSVEVGELADVVDFRRAVRLLAQLASSGLKPGDQLFPPDVDRAWCVVGQDRVPLAGLPQMMGTQLW